MRRHEKISQLTDDVRGRLRALAHDLSNSLETVLQAAYLLQEAKLDGKNKKWAQAIDDRRATTPPASIVRSGKY